MATDDELNLREQITRIDRAIAANARHRIEQRNLAAEARQLAAAAGQVQPEGRLNRWPPWLVVLTGMAVVAALFGGPMLLVKVLR